MKTAVVLVLTSERHYGDLMYLKYIDQSLTSRSYCCHCNCYSLFWEKIDKMRWEVGSEELYGVISGEVGLSIAVVLLESISPGSRKGCSV